MNPVTLLAWVATVVLNGPIAEAAAAEPVLRPVLQIGHDAPPLAAAWLPDQRYLISAGPADIVTWDTQTGHVINRQTVKLPSAGDRMEPLGFDADGARLLSRILTLAEYGGETTANCAHFAIEAFAGDAAEAKELQPEPAAGCLAAAPRRRSRDGRSWQIAGNDLLIQPGAGGGAEVRLSSTPREKMGVGTVSPDAQFVAQLAVEGLGKAATTRIVARSLRTGRDFPERRFPGAFGTLLWLNDAKLLLIPTTPDEGFCANGDPPQALVVNAVTGEIIDRMESLRDMMQLGRDGAMIGIGPPGCGTTGKRLADAVWVRMPGPKAAWRPLPIPTLAGRDILELAARPDGSGIALLTASPRTRSDLPSRNWRILLAALDGDGQLREAMLLPTRFDDPKYQLEKQGHMWGFAIGRDGRVLVVGIDGHVLCFDAVTGKSRFRDDQLPDEYFNPTFFSADRSTLVIGSPLLSEFLVVDLNSGQRKHLKAANLNSVGVLPERNLLWSVGGDGTVRFYDQRRLQRILTSFRLPHGGYFTIDDSGRYDTNQGADTATIRWQLSDRPQQSLPPQMFMRERYEPDLLPRRLDCTTAGNCDGVFRPLPGFENRNFLLPRVRVVAARLGQTPGTADVEIEAEITGDGERSSGRREVRRLRDNRLVATWSPTAAEWAASVAAPGAGGLLRHRFVVAVPVTRNQMPVHFSAYGFNSEQLKGETSDPVLLIPPRLKRQPRAFVLTIGIDRYAIPGRSLNYAGADARAIAAALANMDGYEVHRLTLVSDAGKDAATKANIRAALALLAGVPGDWAAQLARAGIVASDLSAARPDDVVVISWSGHGIADATGHFALLPSDVRQNDPRSLPDPASLVSSDELADWLRPIDAGETVLIIDACHSAASIAAGGFKPGPMGDAGLGQLAFDKGIRVLAATQADDVAMESSLLGLGLLTASLTNNVLRGDSIKASEGWIRLDEALREAAVSVPQLMAAQQKQVQQQDAQDWPPLLVPADPPPSPRLQLPALFDFTGSSSPAWLAVRP